MTPQLQAKLLRVTRMALQRVGSNTEITNARIIACTNRNLESSEERAFSRGFVYRLNVVELNIRRCATPRGYFAAGGIVHRPVHTGSRRFRGRGGLSGALRVARQCARVAQRDGTPHWCAAAKWSCPASARALSATAPPAATGSRRHRQAGGGRAPDDSPRLARAASAAETFKTSASAGARWLQIQRLRELGLTVDAE